MLFGSHEGQIFLFWYHPLPLLLARYSSGFLLFFFFKFAFYCTNDLLIFLATSSSPVSGSKERQLPASKGCQFRHLTAVGFGSSSLRPGEGTGNIPSLSVTLQSPFLVTFFFRARYLPINKINGSNDSRHMIARDWGIRSYFRMVSENTRPLCGDQIQSQIKTVLT